jgi:hypothetical protein
MSGRVRGNKNCRGKTEREKGSKMIDKNMEKDCCLHASAEGFQQGDHACYFTDAKKYGFEMECMSCQGNMLEKMYVV